MGKRTDSAATAASVARIERQDQAVELRRQGRSYRAIAEALHCSRATAAELVQEGLRAIPAANVEELRKVDGERLDELWAGITAPAEYDDKGRLIRGGAADGEPQAISAAVKVLERRARLFGLDAPTKLDATVGRKSLKDMSDEELLALKAEMAAAKESV